MRKLIAVLISGLILAAILFSVNLAPTVKAIRAIPTDALIVCLVLIAINLLIVTLRLQRMLQHFGSRLSYSTAFHASLSGLIASLFLINVIGSVVGRQVVLRTAGISAALSTLVSGYERFILALVGGVLALAGGMSLIGSGLLDDLFKGLPVIPIALALGSVGTFVLVTANSSFERDIMARLRHPRRIVEVSEIVVISGISQLINMYVYVLILSSMGFHVPIAKLIAASAMVSFAASMPISVNGWGVREIASIYAFGLLGVDAPSATAASIAVGLINTLVIVIVSPIFIASRRFHSVCPRRATTVETGTTANTGISGQDAIDFHKVSSWALGVSIPILLFFQFPVNVSGTTVTINLGDLFALLGFGLVAAQASFGGPVSFRLSGAVVVWLSMATVGIYLSLAIGVYRFGAIPWAIGNRGIGWLVVLGYFASGAYMTGQFGRQGIRRIAQILLATGCVVTTVHLLHRTAYALDWTTLSPPMNFEGFSANRNAFAFQLLITLGLAIFYLLPIKTMGLKTFGAQMALLVFAIIATNSLTGYVSLICLAAVLANSRKALIYRSIVVGGAGLSLYCLLPVLLIVVYDFIYFSRLMWNWLLATWSHRPSWTSNGVTLKEVIPGLPTNRIAGNEDSSVAERLSSLRGGLALWRSYPVFGAGLGAFISTQISKSGVPLVIHSTYVWIVAEMGTIGLLLTCWVPICQFPRIWRGSVSRPKRMLGGMRKNDSAIVVIILIFCIFSLAHEIAYQRIFWFVLGSLLASPGRMSLLSVYQPSDQTLAAAQRVRTSVGRIWH